MIKSDEACGSFSSSSTSDTFPGNSNSKEVVSKLFSNLFNNKCSLKNSNLLAITGSVAASDTSDAVKKTNASSNEPENEEKTNSELYDSYKTSSVPENNTANENDTSLPLSTDTVILDRNKSPSNSKVPVPTLTLHADNAMSTCEVERGNLGGIKLVDSGTLRRVCSSSKIPVSTRRLNAESQSKIRIFPATEKYFKRQPTCDNNKEPSQKRSEKIGSKKYNHIKSKVAAYIHRPTKTEFATRNVTRSMSPIDSKIRNDNLCGAGEGFKRMSSRTSLETYTCEHKMPSADASIDLDKSEYLGDSQQRIRKHIELALEHNRRKLEKELIIAEHHRVIAKQHQQVVEHSEKANDSLQKAFTLLLDKVTEKS